MVPVALAVRVQPGGDSPGKPEGQTDDAAAGQTDDAAAVRPMMASVPSEAESADTTGHGMCWMPSSRQMSAARGRALMVRGFRSAAPGRLAYTRQTWDPVRRMHA